MKLKWAFGLPGVSASGSQVSVVGNRVFVGSRNGVVYALDAKSGCLVWAVEADASVRSTPVVVPSVNGRAMVYFGDAHANAYGVDAATGAVVWKSKVEDHGDAMITGGAAYANGRIYVPVASLEESSGGLATYQCCTFRGSVVALDAASGKQIWKTYTIPEVAQPTTRNSRGTQLYGPSGAGVWSTPAVDAGTQSPLHRHRRQLLAARGAHQRRDHGVGDGHRANSVGAPGAGGRRVEWRLLRAERSRERELSREGRARSRLRQRAGAGDAARRPPPGGRGAEVGRAACGQRRHRRAGVEDARRVRAAFSAASSGDSLLTAPRPTSSLSNALERKPGEAGGLVAVNLADGKPRWSAPPVAATCGTKTGCNTGQPAAVSAMPGVVFSGALDGHLRAYDAASGKVIWDIDTTGAHTTVNGVAANGGGLNGPGATIAGGMLFVSSGYGSIGFMPGNVLLAFSVDGR